MSASNLDGQVAVITGASSGIGLGVAEALRAAGMKLIINARRADRLQHLARRLGECLPVPGDITDTALPQKLIDAAVQQFGRCDVVFNGAGVMHTAAIAETHIETMSRMIRINLEAATRVAYAALKHFQKVGRGYLINVSSILGTKVRPQAGVYSASKYGLEALSQALRMEVAKTSIKISVIEPGLVSTELQDHFPVHPREMFGITQPLTPADIARCVLFLLEQPEHVRIPVMMILPGEQSA